MKTNEPVKGILIDPVNRTITEVQVSYTKEAGLFSTLYKLLDCDMIEPVRMKGNVLWCDEEGLHKPNNPAFAMAGVGQGMFVGKAIVLGGPAGKSDSKLTLEQVKALVGWTTKVAVG